MKSLYIEKTKSTPEIEFNDKHNSLKISGQSYPENAFKFYEPVTQWVEEYIASKPAAVNIEINIAYVNTSSSKCLMDILDRFQDAHEEGLKVELTWYCNAENENELECAKEFLEDLTFDHKIITVQE